MEANTQQQKVHHHHILSEKVAITIGLTLMFLTFVTVAIAKVDLGPLNFFIAMVVASAKAMLVILFFMNLKYDKTENAVIFFTSFLFLAIFLVQTGTDLFFRGDVYVKGPFFAQTGGGNKSSLKEPWIGSPDLVAKGKTQYANQCVACHGAEGKGDGPAASALNPRPRNFHDPNGWKNGRSPAMIFKTLKEGLPPSSMASYATLPLDDRWALTHYVLSLGPQPAPTSTPAELAKIGVDVSKPGGGGVEEAKEVSLRFAMERVKTDETQAEINGRLYHPRLDADSSTLSAGARTYERACVQCHGSEGQGGIRVRNLGVRPLAYVTTEPFTKATEGLKSQAVFDRWVIEGLPGELMPGHGELSRNELKELYQYIQSLAARR